MRLKYYLNFLRLWPTTFVIEYHDCDWPRMWVKYERRYFCYWYGYHVLCKRAEDFDEGPFYFYMKGSKED